MCLQYLIFFYVCFCLGPNYRDNGRHSYAHGPYGGPLREPAPNHSWAFPPRPMHHREVMHRRPSLDGPIPVASRGLLLLVLQLILMFQLFKVC